MSLKQEAFETVEVQLWSDPECGRKNDGRLVWKRTVSVCGIGVVTGEMNSYELVGKSTESVYGVEIACVTKCEE